MRSIVVLGAILAMTTLAVYWQTGQHEFISLDDYEFITGNPHVNTGLSKDNLLWAISPVRERGWFPLTWLSHMADVELYGLNPRGHHLTNVFFHLLATLTLFTLLFRTTQAPWKSLFVAWLFALHPLHVESVAWVAERRDVLSAFFGFLCLLLYACYLSERRFSLYLAALGTFALGLMAKPMLVTLPLVMLLFDYWPLNRYGRETIFLLLKEKVPFLIGSLLCALITLQVSPVPGSAPALDLRVANAIIAYVKYLVLMFWPMKLAIYYPLPQSIPPWQIIASLLILTLVTVAVIRTRGRHPYLIVGWLWFLVTLVPVSGLVQFANHALADRYTYIPLTGLFMILAWGVPAGTASHPRLQRALPLLAVIMCTLATVLTWQQLRHWQNDISLYGHTLKVASGSLKIHKNLGIALAVRGQLDDAIVQFEKVLAIDPNDIDAHYNLGLALAEKGVPQRASGEFQAVIRLNPRDFGAYLHLGTALVASGDVRGGIAAYNEALEINPASAEARALLYKTLANQAKPPYPP